MTSKMDIRGYKPADETFYDYKDEEETPRGTHHSKEDDEDINNSTVGRYASGEDFKHWPFKVGNAMTNNIPEDVQHKVNDGGSSGYSSMQNFMEEDSAKEQAWVDRENDSIFTLAINNWFGLKSYILSFFPKK